jgi:tRNA(fMet)-specific endonuclease VapC
MEAVLLDTDVFSYLLKNDSRGALYKPHIEGKTVAISFVTVGELYAWADVRGWGERRRRELDARIRAAVVIPSDDDVCREYGRLAAIPIPAGNRTLSANDRWIAACALRHSLPLVTNNRRHFEAIPGLEMVTGAIS